MPLDRAKLHASRYLDSLGTAPVGVTEDLATLRSRLAKPLSDAGLPAEQVIDELVADSQGGIVGTAGGRFFAWVIGGATPAALAADWLTSAWDQNAGVYAAAPAAAIVEEVAGGWLKELLNIPSESSFAFVTGCQMAHVTCLAAARHAVLAAKGWDVEENGLNGAPPIRVVASPEYHVTIEKALRLLGMGRRSDSEMRFDDRPTILCLRAGELNTGAFDNFAELIPLAKKHNAWVHIDGAFGLWAAASSKYCHLLTGADQADSWATDGHKWLNVPYDSGYAFVRHPDAHRASMTMKTSYLIYDGSARDQIDWNPEFSRRARGFTTYAAIRELGRTGIARLVERCCEHARTLVNGIGALDGAEVICEPMLNQGLVRFGDDDARTDEVIARAVASGECFVGGVTFRGKRCMRVSVSNWRTTHDDVQRVIEAFRKIL